MTRNDLHRIAQIRRREAKILLDANQPAGAYYLCGYAVECALKACIARKTERFEFPDEPRARLSWHHDLQRLLAAAALDQQFAKDAKADVVLGDNWAVVVNWKETARYSRTIDRKKAADLYKAVTKRKNGVLAWLRRHW